MLLKDFTKAIRDEDLPYFTELMTLIESHMNKAKDYGNLLAFHDRTRSMLDYLRRTGIEAGLSVGTHVALLAETDTQRQKANHCKAYHVLCASVFQSQLEQFLIKRYGIHKSNVKEWHVDITNMEIYRRVKIDGKKAVEKVT